MQALCLEFCIDKLLTKLVSLVEGPLWVPKLFSFFASVYHKKAR